MNYYFITGTSRGIGKALVELLLQSKDNFVFGISRTQSIKNKNYKHFKIDLNNLDKVKEFVFPEFKNADSIVLINNSAHSGEIVHFGKHSQEDIIESFNVSLVSPAVLINNFLKVYQSYECRRLIMNISSGAARMPVESWGTYCSAKAGLAMLSEVINIEQKLGNNPVFIFSVAPGIVDTKMQDNIRKVSPDDFRDVGKFIEFKVKNMLSKPEDVAVKLMSIINSPDKFEQVALDVRTLKSN